jgi:hypothetical protein
VLRNAGGAGCLIVRVMQTDAGSFNVCSGVGPEAGFGEGTAGKEHLRCGRANSRNQPQSRYSSSSDHCAIHTR